MPKVSVLMPVYNADRFLKEAIDSIIEQSYSDWELIIINDGSIDKSEQIALSYTDDRIKYFVNEKNLGLIDTLNKGIDICQGEYVARMDADDISTSDRLEKQVEFLDKHPECAICGCQATVIDNNGQPIGQIINLYDNEYLQINLLFSVPFIHPGVTMRKTVLKENRYNENYKHAEDYDLWCNIAQNYKVNNLSDFLLKYRWHNTNVSIVNAKQQEIIKDQIILKQLKSLNITPTEEELFLHKVTFKQYNSKERINKKPFNQYEELNEWFAKIIKANNHLKRYNNDALIAFLWSRWIVLCMAQKQYGKCLFPRFVKFKPSVICRTIKLICFLSKK